MTDVLRSIVLFMREKLIITRILQTLVLSCSFLTQIQEFKRGDEVVVKSDKKLVKELQEGHGGWNEAMISVSSYVYCLFVC